MNPAAERRRSSLGDPTGLTALPPSRRRAVASAARRLAPEFDRLGLALVVEVASQSCRDLREYPDGCIGELVERVTRQRLFDRMLQAEASNGSTGPG